MIATGLRLFSQDEYHRMITTGILDPEERLELLEGQIISMAAKNPPHSATNLCAAEYLRTLLAGLALIRIQDPINLSSYSEPEPDIAVVRINPRFYAENHPTPADTFLLIEISDTTLEQDRKQKAAAYAKAGIADYWILDVNTRQVRVFREIVNQTYQQETILNEEATLFLLAFPEIEVQISRLFP
ncbi:Uma2 family endonuclease [Phormidium sp. LEGE 05292]|uniref:Uma2 family endonuclease n=1 Tax=[Phormidium] sp. LEGE 05292 TaxID=767427 RepID=UPI00188065A0|nr:Uma2 family endonuclease [Phormidium sp. LEGE 05292]MBE9225532.1 Uma2 family endonuclease [Phormidium sp. LEGE 05292]